MTAWTRKVGRYTVCAVFVVGSTCAVGWPLLGPDGRRGLLLAAGVALVVQMISFGVLAALRPGTPGFMLIWGGGTLVRFAVVGIGAFLIASMEGVDLTVTLLVLVSLFFVLLLLEPWALRERENRWTNG